jgi:hypothetical protein
MSSLRNLSLINFVITAALLAVLVATGFRQNTLLHDYSVMVKESESTIFFYSTIREQTIEGLFSRNSTQLQAAAQEVEQLQARYTAMLESPLIPSPLKLSFLQNLDLEQLVIDLRKLAGNATDNTLLLKIVSQLRQINTQFLQFDRVIVSEMRNKVMQYQKRCLILMGLIISLTSFSLIALYQKSVKPLLSLSSQAEQALVDGVPLILKDDGKNSKDVQNLINNLNQKLSSTAGTSSSDLTSSLRKAEISAIINEVINRLNGIINYSQLLADHYEAEEMGAEQKDILNKIIENGEKSAEILYKGLQEGGGDCKLLLKVQSDISSSCEGNRV